jgi:hypothetical protein
VTEAEWAVSGDAYRMLELPSASVRKTGLFVVACCRLPSAVRNSRPEEEGVLSVERAEQYADLAWEEHDRWYASIGYNHVWRTDYIAPAFAWGTGPVGRDSSSLSVWCGGVGGSPHIAVICPGADAAGLVREVFGNPFRRAPFTPEWRSATALTLARQMYDTRDFSALPILADALQDAGCDNEDILDHCRGPGPHVRGCWVVDLVLGKE